MRCVLLLGLGIALALRLKEDPKPKQTTIDVGLEVFVQNLTRDLVANATATVGANASSANLTAFEETVKAAVDKDVKAALLPVKKEIAGHWMDLKPEKRDQYVELLKVKFAELLQNAEQPYLRHASIKFHAPGAGYAVDLNNETQVTNNLEWVMKSPTTRLVSSLKDYSDLLYMSNIFIAVHEKHSREGVFLEIK